ncbi:MAG: tetratricopeptide repeat protein [Acidobacteriota bacterium]|nr:tetratricopeptide repeat protein [Acidobacteriota bacterium]
MRRPQSQALRPPPAVAARVPKQAGVRVWQFAAAALLAFAALWWAYSPALHGEFLFDDLHLPFLQPAAAYIPLWAWLHVRPLLMVTYWANLHAFGVDPFSYHAVNLLFHFTASVLLLFAVRKIFLLAGVAEPARSSLAILSAAVFLLHPAQTEAVSYVAQRGESMAAVFFFAAWCVFLYRGSSAVTWPVAAAVLALYGAAVATKEHTVTLPAVLLLTDFFFNPGGIRRNWRLYLPIAVGGLLGAVFVVRYLSRDTGSIGFSLKEFTWRQYLFTEWRVFFVYLALFLFPVSQTIDYDFPVSRSPFDHGAIFALLAILALGAAAVLFRKRFPLAAYGFLLFIILLLPTSSVIPIKDLVAERRLYLPMVGLLLVLAEALRRIPRQLPWVAAILIVILGTATFARNRVWATSLAMWEDAARKAPAKQRVQFGLAVADFRAGRCKESVEHYARAAQIESPDYTILMDWALAYECDHQTDQAVRKMRESIRLKPSAQAWASMAVLEARQGKVPEALDALQKAQALDPGYPITYLYRGSIHQALNQIPQAIENFKMVLSLDPGNQIALKALTQLQGQAR